MKKKVFEKAGKNEKANANEDELNEEENVLLGNSRAARKTSPWDEANLISKYFLAFILPLIKLARIRLLRPSDIPRPARVDESRYLADQLKRNYDYQYGRYSGGPSFTRAMFWTFAPKLAKIGIFDVINKCLISPLQMIALGWLIRDTSNYATTILTGTVQEIADQKAVIYYSVIVNTCILLACSWTSCLIISPYFLLTNRVAMRCRIAASALIYRKALRLSQSGLAESGRGQITNLLSNDVNRFEESVQEATNLVSCPIQAVILLFILAQYYIGVAATMITLLAVLILLIIQTFLGKQIGSFRRRIASKTDERVKLLNDIIVGIRIIKMYAWEEPFKLLARDARRRELMEIGKAAILKALNGTLFFSSSKLLVFISLVSFKSLGFNLNPETTFVTLGISNLLRLTLTFFFPSAIAHWVETLVSCSRINKFLKLKEKRQSRAHYKRDSDFQTIKGSSNLRIEFERVTATWSSITTNKLSQEGELDELDQDSESSSDTKQQKHQTESPLHRDTADCVLRNVDMEVKEDELVLLVGRVGSGKSSLLLSILGELPVARGRVHVAGKLSYAAQESWVFPGSVRDNIIFGSAYNQQRYDQVIKCCCLTRDLEILPKGDSTLVGERGVSLSGGQKARVNLARALYQDADIYLLDDPLSAVDAPVARDIFKNAIQTFLTQKTVILATHQLQFIDRADKLLVLRGNGKSPLFGTWDNLKPKLTDEDLVLDSYMKKASQEEEEKDEQQEANRKFVEQEQQAASKLLAQSSSSSSKQQETNLQEQQTAMRGEIRMDLAKDSKKGGEKVSAIAADLQSYVFYRKEASNWLGVIWFVLISFVSIAFGLYNDIFLTMWTDSEQRKQTEAANFQPQSFIDSLMMGSLIGYYALVLILLFVTTFIRSMSLFWATLNASRSIHARFLESIVHTGVRFFDFTAIGLILNRVSRDIGYIDEILPQTIGTILTIFMNVAGSIGLTIIIQPLNAIPTLALFLLALLMRNYVSRAIIRTKQIEGANRTPIFSHLSISLDGLSTIRALEVEPKFVNDFDLYQDSHSGAWFVYICSGRILSFAIDLVMVTMITAIVIIQVIINIDSSSASTLGLLITQIIWLPGPVQWGMRQLVELESQMTSVQRIKEYSFLERELDHDENSPGGAASHSKTSDKSKRLSITAAAPPRIDFKNLRLSYFSDEEAVLKGLTFSIKSGEKVGVVGRTGAGKSSLVGALFRMYPYEGSIELDGLDTSQLSLRQLRSSISIIPQDPVLFCGDLRRNLDPFNEHQDDDLWSALEAVQLKHVFAQQTTMDSTSAPSSAGLDFVIQPSGSNLSVGQRQLICLARAILRRNKVLILDEATANVDPETDKFIQETIGQQFKDCTILTIAHRLLTIVDSDRVLVMDSGRVVEFDSPLVLSKQKDSLFSSMLDSNQSRQANVLRNLIEEAASTKSNLTKQS